jgi:CRP/FNR family transcriptional regulator, nitrogen oxide reductase regulator
MTARKRTPLATERVEPRACTLPRRLDVLRQTPFFANLPADVILQISGFFHEKGFTAGQTIYTAGDPAVSLYVVAIGKVKLTRTTEAGKTVVLGVIGPGDFFGSLSALGDLMYPDSAVAHTACCVLAVAGIDFQAILRGYPQVANATLEIVAARLASMHELVEQLSVHPAEQRIASTLLALAGKLGQKRGNAILIQMPLSRQDLAEMTGITPETASRILMQFRRSGLIRSGRRWVAILNPARLAAEARHAQA